VKRNASLVLRNAAEVLCMTGPAPAPQAPQDERPLGLVRNASVAIDGDTVVFVGRTSELDAQVALRVGGQQLDCSSMVIAPGLVDAHTHSLFVGDRSDEFVARIAGESYAQIAARGGGIASSVRALRASDDASLVSTLCARLDRMRRYGVSCVEVKTGYGLDTLSELRALAAIKRAKQTSCVRVVDTFLGLHAVDPTLRGTDGGRETFVRRTLEETWPAVLAHARPDFVDAYVDSTGFSLAECEPLLRRAARDGVRSRLHVGQFADIGGAQLAASLKSASADHLEHISEDGLRALARAGVVGVLLPGAAFSLGQSMPDARRMRDAGVELALATDCNPGTSYVENLPLMAAFAVRQMGLSTVEAWWALTRAPARALERFALGRIAVGLPADVTVFAMQSYSQLPYALGSVMAAHSVINGKVRSYL
jgi:imidazolonepropionase